MKRILTLAVTLGILILLGAMYSSLVLSENIVMKEYSRQEIASDDNTLVWETIGNPRYMDPHNNYEPFGSWIHYNVYETLFTYEWDSLDTEPTVPLLAEGLEISSDGLIYTFTLRQGITFHDGTPFNASCVQYNFERMLGTFDSNGSVRMVAESILGGAAIKDAVDAGNILLHEELWNQWVVDNKAGTGAVTVLDDYTVRIRLAYAYASFLSVITYEVGAIISPTFVESHGGIIVGQHNEYIDEHTCGTGPYMLDEWTRNERIVLKRNTNYWRESQARQRFPYAGAVDTVIIKTNEDTNSRILNIQTGVADSIYWPVSNAYQIYNNVSPPPLEQNDGTVQSLNPNLTVWAKYPTFNIASVHFTMSDTLNELTIGKIVENPFKLKNVRKALSCAFDYQTAIDDILNGFGVQGQGPIPHGMFGHNDSALVYPYNLDKAIYYWNKAMYDDDLDSTLENNSYRLVLYYNSGNDARRKIMNLLRDGIENMLALPETVQPSQPLSIDVQGIEWSTYIHEIINGRVGVWVFGLAPEYADPHNYVWNYVKSTGTYAYWARLGVSPGWDAVTVDGWIDAATKSQGVQERVDLYGKIQDAIIEHAAYIWVWQRSTLHVSRSGIQNIQYGVNPLHGTYFYHCWDVSAITPTETTDTSFTPQIPDLLTISNIITIGSSVFILVVIVLIIRGRQEHGMYNAATTY